MLFSTMTSQVAMRRRSSSRPGSPARSRVTLFLLVLRPAKIPDRSHQSGSEKRSPASNRVPSGRAVDSMWRTSAPSIASTWVHSGPAQNEVRSSTRRPAERQPFVGFVSHGGLRRRGRLHTGRARRVVVLTQPGRRLGRPQLGRVEPVGPVRFDEVPRGFVTIDPRAWKWSVRGIVAPLPIGACGMRNAPATSRISAIVCSAIHAATSGFRWARLANSERSSVHSGWSTIAQKSSHCWPVPTPRPTRPSLAASTPGVMIDRPLRNGRPTMSA